MCQPYHYSLNCSRTRFRSRGYLCVHTVSYSLHCSRTRLQVEVVCVSTSYHYSFIVQTHALEVEGAFVSTSNHFSFIGHTHALEVEDAYVSTSNHYSFIGHTHALAVERACVSTPYHYNLHCSRTRFRSRGSLCVHIISIHPSLVAYTLEKKREPLCPHHIITVFIVCMCQSRKLCQRESNFDNVFFYFLGREDP